MASDERGRSQPEDSQIACRFTTRLPAEYVVPSAEIAVPAKLTRYGLSQVVNHLLGLEEAVPFDFLVNGELVRLSLGKHTLSKNISTESVLEIEYILAVTPPEQDRQLPHDDWVSAVDGSRPDAILSGCYDGLLRVWNGEGEVVSSGPIHRGPVSALASLPEEQGQLLLSAGKLDHVIRLLQLAGKEVTSSTSLAVYKGHGGSVLGVAAAPDGLSFASASQDKSVRIWRTGAEVATEAREAGHGAPPAPKKKQRLRGGAAAAVQGGLEVTQTAELVAHTDAATAVAWGRDGGLYSGSMDHSVRKWDAATGTNVDTLNDRKAVACVALPPGGRELVAFAGAARALRLWDPRARHAEDGGVRTFSSHTSHIQALAWHPSSEHHLVTGSLDKSLKLWDLRSAVPLHTLEGHTEQVLCAAWWGPGAVVSGGADNTVRTFKVAI